MVAAILTVTAIGYKVIDAQLMLYCNEGLSPSLPVTQVTLYKILGQLFTHTLALSMTKIVVQHSTMLLVAVPQ